VTATASYRTSDRTRSSAASARPTGHQHRRSQGRRPGSRIRRILAVLLVLTLLGGAGWLIGFSQVLATRHVTIIGLDRVDASSIREPAAVPIGLPLARQDLRGIASRVSSLPKIKSAEVGRRWPHTIRITVEERRPLLGVRQPEGFVIVDAQGVAFDTQPSLPDGVVQADVALDRPQLLAEVGAIVATMPPDLQRRVVRLHATSRNNVMVLLAQGVEVNWGTDADSALKSQLVLALLKRKPAMIDVSSPHNPAIR
jgi:cell division protein FtsQ